ncbi:hypothetical protein AB2H60_24895 (plasmid) [Escherichia coli]
MLTGCDYRVLIGDLDDEQMHWLSQIGNDYRPISAYERGKRYLRKLNDFDGNVKLGRSNIDRNIITRCINTAGLPKDYISYLQSSRRTVARAGDSCLRFTKKHGCHEQCCSSSSDNKKRRGFRSFTDYTNII